MLNLWLHGRRVSIHVRMWGLLSHLQRQILTLSARNDGLFEAIFDLRRLSNCTNLSKI